MKGENKMTFNPGYAELLGKELQRNRMREAEKQRLIRTVTLANPSTAKKVWIIFRSRWQDLRKPKFKSRTLHPDSTAAKEISQPVS